MESPLGTLGVSANSTPKVTQCWRPLEGTCDPGQARFSAFLMLSQVPHDWIGTEVVFHSPEVLRSCGDPLGTMGMSADFVPKETRCWSRQEGTCDPGQAGFSASLMLSQVLHHWN